ncbi:MAG TPA: amidase family protein, partial [Candidatus Paceibacterota bacterium]|nr:amidase family protein [Candidatus Paceibacterota bacterium]
MGISELASISITEAARKLGAKEISALDLVRACLKNIEVRDKSLNAYLEVFDDVEAQAKKADERRAKGESHPLLGIP